MIDAEEKYLIWLCACTDLDYRARALLLRAAKSPKNLFSAFEKYVSSVIKEEGTLSTVKPRSEREREADRVLGTLAEKGYFAVTLFSDDYPEALKAVREPPFVLFGAGKRELLGKRKFTVVGSRVTPPYAEKQGRAIAEKLSERFAVVSGLAEGGDAAAIRGAMPNVICVLPNGLDECYPASHASLKEEIRRNGLLLSEYPLHESVKKYHFYARNRILAGLSEGVLVISAGAKSGALITANCALEYGRDVFAFPYNVGVAQGVGCNELIKNGAGLCTEAEDILSWYGISAPAERKIPLSAEEERVLGILRESGELHAAALAERAGLKIYEIAATLSSLELKGLAVKTGGNRYGAV